MKIYIVLATCFLLYGCGQSISESSMDNYVSKQMLSWIQKHSQGDFEGWAKVDWSKAPLADLSHKTDDATNKEGESIANQLSDNFVREHSASQDKLIGDYYDTGITVHGQDNTYDAPDYLFDPIKDFMATSFVRRDMTLWSSQNTHYIWNSTFQFDWAESPGKPSPGVIYKSPSMLKSDKDKYSFFCLYVSDGWSGKRYNGCDYDPTDTTRPFKEYRSAVKKAWNDNTSIDFCKLNGINNYSSYSRTINDAMKRLPKGDNVAPRPCGFSSDQEGFDKFLDIYKKFPLASRPGGDVYTEFIMKMDSSNYPNIVAGIYYLTSNKDLYYASPTDPAIKKYNVHLGEAQKQQKRLWSERHTFKPILEINMDELSAGKRPVHYHPEDQVINNHL